LKGGNGFLGEAPFTGERYDMVFILQDGVRRIVKLKYKRFNYDFDL
jgi:hypothetical protein